MAASSLLNLPQSFEKLLDERVRFLTDYQDARYARRYLDAVRRVQAAERADAPGARRPRPARSGAFAAQAGGGLQGRRLRGRAAACAA